MINAPNVINGYSRWLLIHMNIIVIFFLNTTNQGSYAAFEVSDLKEVGLKSGHWVVNYVMYKVVIVYKNMHFPIGTLYRGCYFVNASSNPCKDQWRS